MRDPIYLDYNATAPIRPEVRDAVIAAFGVAGNPSSVHGFGRRARRVVEDARAEVAALERLLAEAPEPALVSVMRVNNETGVIQPLADVVRIAHAHGALVHCDAIQAAGRLPLEVDTLGIDLMTLSAHKLGGPQGVGALIVRDGLPITPVLRGGGQEHRRRAGTENVPG